MNIQSINNTYNTSFNGIKLSTSNFYEVRDIVNSLKFCGINCVGHKTFNVNNTLKDKARIANFMKNNYPFPKNQFGVIFFPFGKEAYIVADKAFEQKLIKYVQKLDSKAEINLYI